MLPFNGKTEEEESAIETKKLLSEEWEENQENVT